MNRIPAVLLAVCASGAPLSASDLHLAGRLGDGPIVVEVEFRAGNAADPVGNKARDMAITSEINAKLTADERLGALRIEVDTVDGRVVLRGDVPDAAARARATELAVTVDGVVEVRNDLQVPPAN